MKWRSEYSEKTMTRRNERVKEARETDIVEVVTRLGIQFDNSYKSKVTGKKSYKIKNTNIYVSNCTFRDYDNDDKGHTVDYLIKYQGMSFNQAVEYLTAPNNDVEFTRVEHVETSKAKKPADVTLEYIREQVADSKFDASGFKVPTERTIKYLTETRKLDKDIVDYLIKKGMIMSDKYNNACFMAYFEGKLVGSNKRGIVDKPGVKPFKGIHAGSSSEVGFHLVKGKPTRILFFEGTIDLISYLTIYKNQPQLNNTVFATITGLKIGAIESFIAMFPGCEPVLCLDNDKAAANFIEFSLEDKMGKLKKEIPHIRISDTILKFYKDWNEMLVKGAK